MAGNIYNPATGQQGYQVPGAPLSAGWQYMGTPNPTTGRTLPSPQITSATTVTGDSPAPDMGTFNTALMGLLKQYQTLGTKPFVQQGLDAQQEQNNRIFQTNPALIGASPDVQNSVRNASSQAVQPTINSAQNSAQTMSEQIKGLGSAIDSARNFSKDYETTLNAKRDDARAVINEILTTTDPNSLKHVNPDDLSALEKASGYPKGFLQDAITYKQQQQQLADYKAGLGSTPATGYTYVKGQDPVVDAWVQNINSGKAKLSDITNNPSLKNKVSSGLAGSSSSASEILQTTKDSLKELNDMVTNNQGFTGAVGFRGLVGSFTGPVAGSDAANFANKAVQVVNDVVLPNLTILHGLGRVTDREFQALTSAVSALGLNLDKTSRFYGTSSLGEDQFKKELKDITDRINSIESSSAAGGATSGVTPSGLKYQIVP